MRAIAASKLGSLDDYVEVTFDISEVSAGQLLIAVSAVGLGYVDALIACGGYQVKPLLPHVPGTEIVGKVAAIGPGVAGWAIGDRVIAMAPHALADFVVVEATVALHVPPGVSDSLAASLPLNYLTAIHGLVDRAGIRAGECLLVLGAAGGVGSAAVQVGRALGAYVIAAASTGAKRDFALSHGAHATIDTEEAGWRDRLKAILGERSLDVAFDPVCGPLFQPVFRSLSWRGRHLVVGFVGGPIPALPSNLALMKGAALVGVDVRQFQLLEPQRAREHLLTMLTWIEDGRVTPAPERCFPWSDARAALKSAFSGEGNGKVVLIVGPRPQVAAFG